MAKKKKRKKASFPLGKMLGAHSVQTVQQLLLYIPDKDKNGKPIKAKSAWLKEAQSMMSKIGGGCTTYPSAVGAWLNPDTQKLIIEGTTLVYTYVLPQNFNQHKAALKAFVHAFGYETNQGEVIVFFAGDLYRITKFDPA